MLNFKYLNCYFFYNSPITVTPPFTTSFIETLILVPSLYLLSQIYSEFAIDLIDTDTKFILIGSDSEHKDVFLSTDRNNILEQLVTDSKIIVISTYQSCYLLNNIDIDDNTIFDYCIKDECEESKKLLDYLYIDMKYYIKKDIEQNMRMVCSSIDDILLEI